MPQTPLGYILDGATPVQAAFVSREPPKLGDYVVIEFNGYRLLGFVESIGARSVILATSNMVKEPETLQKLPQITDQHDLYFEGRLRIIGDLSDPSLKNPRLPPPPGTPVYPAPRDVLEQLFGAPHPGYIRLGVLAARPDIPVYVDVNKLVSRHLAILAVTGAGKSNTVAVITDQLVRMGGSVLILDFHGEYVNSDLGGGRVNVIEAKLPPRLLSVQELMILAGIEPRYYNQERVLRKAYAAVKGEMGANGKSFLDALSTAVEKLRHKEDSKAVSAVLNKLENLRDKYGDILDDNASDPFTRLKPGYANILNLAHVDEDAADVIASYLLRRILWARKLFKLEGRGLPYPIFIVVEEAHILAPKDEDRLSKYWLARIAREGRKFGVGLCLVSQRPKKLDPDILSQMNNKIVLRIVEPSDQKYVQEASEALSDELLEQLPSLNVGEAVILGPMIRIPAVVKIDQYKGVIGGGDPDIVSAWMAYRGLTREDETDVLDIMEDFISR